ncbi:S4 domain-containing protein, partial [uncultured Eubacterium sp.]|uniref:S4 domain-containing protein n=1 Tax=uncultured Eubacterium sp. TaxID=165185 RepID=UPI0033904A78
MHCSANGWITEPPVRGRADRSMEDNARADRRISFRVDGENAGKRLDVIIPKQAEGVSRSMAQNLLGDGRVRVNGQVEWKK